MSIIIAVFSAIAEFRVNFKPNVWLVGFTVHLFYTLKHGLFGSNRVYFCSLFIISSRALEMAGIKYGLGLGIRKAQKKLKKEVLDKVVR